MKIHEISAGYSCTAGLTNEGWFTAINCLQDNDREYTEDIPNSDRKVRLKEGKSRDEWVLASVSQHQRLVLIRQSITGIVEESLAYAEKISIPCTIKQKLDRPVVCWSEKSEMEWILKLKDGTDTKQILNTSNMISNPSIALYKDRLLIAAEIDDDSTHRIKVLEKDGGIIFECDGRRPSLCSAKDNLYLLCERSDGTDSGIYFKLFELHHGHKLNEWSLRSDDININGDLAFDYNMNILYISWESSPMWGYNHNIGMHRDINLWNIKRGGGPEPAQGTCTGRVSVELIAYSENNPGSEEGSDDMNMTPIFPGILTTGRGPALTFRRFRFRDRRCFGWDVYLTEWDGARWTKEARISENFGPADSQYSVLYTNNEKIGFFPCCDNEPGFRRTSNHRVEIQTIPAEGFPKITIPSGVRGMYKIPFSIQGAGTDPLPLMTSCGYKLLWGDFHTHSFYSKCMCSVNGSPGDHFRYTRDILGYRVLTLTDHLHHMSAAESTWQLDRLEEAAGGGAIVIYGCEPGISPGEHTNFYTLDRDIFEELRVISISQSDRKSMYDEIKKHLPAGSVIAIRHFHGYRGKYGIQSHETVETWDPELEVSMEAMQTRGNIMLGQFTQEDQPLFPSNFLNAGARIGLVGGTDHTPGYGWNHFCLTGFWVKDTTAQGIWDAVLNRRTIACSNGKTSIWAELNNEPMGSEMTISGDIAIRVWVSSARPMMRLCLLRDGMPLEWTMIEGTFGEYLMIDENPGPGYHWYSITVESETAFGDMDQQKIKGRNYTAVAHSSPFFVNVR